MSFGTMAACSSATLASQPTTRKPPRRSRRSRLLAANASTVRRPQVDAGIVPNFTGSLIISAKATCLWSGSWTGFRVHYGMS